MVLVVDGCPPDTVCMTVDSAVNIGEWAREMGRVEESVSACSYVVRSR